jgi:hypothetical protein
MASRLSKKAITSKFRFHLILEGEGGVLFIFFYFVQNFFFGQHKSSNIYFFCRAKRNFFAEFNITLYDKNSESDYFFFLHQNQNIF